MNLVDIVLLLLLGLGMYLGYTRGLFISLVRLCAVLVGLLAGTFLWDHTHAWLLRLDIHIPPLSPLLLFIFIFLLTFLLLMVVAKGLRQVIYLTPFRWLDKSIGALFGAAIWTLLLGTLLWLTHDIQHTTLKKHLRHSAVATTLQQSAETVLTWLLSQEHVKKIT